VRELAARTRNEPTLWWFLISESTALAGLLSRETAPEVAVVATGAEPVANVPSLSYIVVSKNLHFYTIIVRMHLANAAAALVTEGEITMPANVVGIIGDEQIAETVSEGAVYFPF
jgi:chloride channel protein, CIC family